MAEHTKQIQHLKVKSQEKEPVIQDAERRIKEDMEINYAEKFKQQQMMDVIASINQRLTDISNKVSGLEANMADVKEEVEALKKELRRQVSHELEKKEVEKKIEQEMFKKVEEETAAAKSIFQQKDKMAAEMDQQTAEMNQDDKTTHCSLSS